MILRNVGGLLGDVIPLNLTDRLYIIIEYIKKLKKVSEGGSEGGLEGGRETERSRVTGQSSIPQAMIIEDVKKSEEADVSSPHAESSNHESLHIMCMWSVHPCVCAFLTYVLEQEDSGINSEK